MRKGMQKRMNENASGNTHRNEARTKETPDKTLHKICIYLKAYVPHKSVYESAFMSLMCLLYRFMLYNERSKNEREMEREEVMPQ